MDYKYIELERQIKSLMNKNFVVSSTRAKSAEEVSNGSCQLYIDTIQKYFIFKVSGINESICVNPLTNTLLNVKYINNVDVSKLIGGVDAGYGITIEDLNDGVYRINVEENKFALKDETYTKTECDDKFALNDDLNKCRLKEDLTYGDAEEITFENIEYYGSHYGKCRLAEGYNVKGYYIIEDKRVNFDVMFGNTFWIESYLMCYIDNNEDIALSYDESNDEVTVTSSNHSEVYDTYLEHVINMNKGDFLVLRSSIYSRNESDEKYMLKSEKIDSVDLSNYYTRTESDELYASNETFNNY